MTKPGRALADRRADEPDRRARPPRAPAPACRAAGARRAAARRARGGSICVQRPVDAGREHRVVRALPAQRAVGQLGREGRVAAVEPAPTQQPGQDEVGVGVLGVAPRAARRTRPGRGRVRLAPGRRCRVRAAGPPAARAGGSRRTARPAAMRAPRAQSAAGIARLPGGCTVAEHDAAAAPVPTRTARRVDHDLARRRGPRRHATGSRTGPSLSRSPRNVVQAPGAGRAAADPPVDAARPARPVDPGVLDRELRRERDALGRLRHRPSVPSLDPVERRDEQPGAAVGHPVEQVAGRVVAGGRLGHHAVDRTGVQALARAGTCVAPVTSSPAMSARWTGAAPRQAGSSEKCRLTQPCARDVERGAAAPARRRRRPGSSPAPARAAASGTRARAAGPASAPRGPALGPVPRPGRHELAAAPGRRVGPGDDGDDLVPRGQRARRATGSATCGVPAKTSRTATAPAEGASAG